MLASPRISTVLVLIPLVACYHGIDLPADDTTAVSTSESSSNSDTGSTTASHREPAGLDGVDACACGCLAWATHLPSPAAPLAHAMAAMPDGGVLLGTVVGSELTLTRLTPTGTLAWTRTSVAPLTDLSLVSVGEGLFALAGSFTGQLGFGPQPPLVSAGAEDGIVALIREDTDSPIWIHGFGDHHNQRVTGLATRGDCAQADLSQCTLILAGVGAGALGIDDLKLGSADQVFTAELPAAQWSDTSQALTPGSGAPQDPPVLVATADGHALFLTEATSGDLGDLTFHRWRAPERSWTTLRFPAEGEQRTGAAALTPDGRFLFLARTLSPIDLGAGILGAADHDTPFLANLTSDDAIAWTLPLAAWPHALAALPNETAMILGEVVANADFGGGTLDHRGNSDAFLAQFDAKGAYRCGRLYGDLERQEGLSLAAGTDRRAFALIRTRGAIDPIPNTWDPNVAAEDLVVLAFDH